MKTAISVPEATFAKVERKAEDLGISRSEFFTTAAKRYLDEDADALVTRINASVAFHGEDDSTAFAVEAGKRFRASLPDEEW